MDIGDKEQQHLLCNLQVSFGGSVWSSVSDVTLIVLINQLCINIKSSVINHFLSFSLSVDILLLNDSDINSAQILISIILPLNRGHISILVYLTLASEAFEKGGGDLRRDVWHNKCLWYKNVKKT